MPMLHSDSNPSLLQMTKLKVHMNVHEIIHFKIYGK